MFLAVQRSARIRRRGARRRAREYRGLRRRLSRLSVTINRRSVFGVMGAVQATIHFHRLAASRHFLLVFLHVDFSHFGGKHLPRLLEIWVISYIPSSAEQTVSGRLIHVQVLDKLARLEPQVLVFIHFADALREYCGKVRFTFKVPRVKYRLTVQQT